MKSTLEKCYDHFEVANGQWSTPDLDYFKSIQRDHSKAAGDHFFKLFEFDFLNLSFE